MQKLIFFLILAAVVIYIITSFTGSPLMRARRQKLLAAPFREDWESILQRRFKTWSRLPEELKSTARSKIQVLMAEKRFEPCGGLHEVTDEMRLVILAQAALLLIGREKHGYFPQLRSILLYPSTYVDHGRRRFGLDDHDVGEANARLGESWTSGSVVLAWDSVLRGAANADDGMNVTLHEFAHQLDQADGSSDGAPDLSGTNDYRDWAEVFQARYEELLEDIDERRKPLLDEYGATNPAEFFSVATETFFEKPERMQEEMGDLYEQLALYYGLDPARWM